MCVRAQERGEEQVQEDKVKTLQSQVDGVKDIMTENVDRILARAEKLDDLMGKSEDLQAGVSLAAHLSPQSHLCLSSSPSLSVQPGLN